MIISDFFYYLNEIVVDFRLKWWLYEFARILARIVKISFSTLGNPGRPPVTRTKECPGLVKDGESVSGGDREAEEAAAAERRDAETATGKTEAERNARSVLPSYSLKSSSVHQVKRKYNIPD